MKRYEGEKTKMYEHETFILGIFKTKHGHEKKKTPSTSSSKIQMKTVCVPQIRVFYHLLASKLCTRSHHGKVLVEPTHLKNMRTVKLDHFRR